MLLILFRYHCITVADLHLTPMSKGNKDRSTRITTNICRCQKHITFVSNVTLVTVDFFCFICFCMIHIVLFLILHNSAFFIPLLNVMLYFPLNIYSHFSEFTFHILYVLVSITMGFCRRGSFWASSSI